MGDELLRIVDGFLGGVRSSHVLRAGLVGSVVFILLACSGTVPSAATIPSAAPTTQSSAAPSVVAPGSIRQVGGLVYATVDANGGDLQLALDLYLPEGIGASPLLIYVHGGGWIEGSRTLCPGPALAANAYAVACIDYRLVGESCDAWSRFPAAVADVRAAVDWLRGRAAEYAFDGSRVALMGESSGGHLAALAGLSSANFDPGDGRAWPAWEPVQAVVDWYGPADIRDGPVVFTDDPCTTALGTLNERYGGEETPFFYWTLAWGRFLGGSLADPVVLDHARRAAPAEYADPLDPPMLIIYGDADGMVPPRQNELLAERLARAGTEVTLVKVPGAGHEYWPPGQRLDIAPEFLGPTLGFLDTAFE